MISVHFRRMHRSRANMRLWQLSLRVTRIVLPRLLRDGVLKLAHEGHKGKVEKFCTKFSWRFIRGFYWPPVRI